MANEQNLRPYHKGELSSEKAREMVAKANDKRRTKKTLRELLEIMLDSKVDEEKKTELKQVGIADSETTQRAYLLLSLLQNANTGNVKAAKMLVDLLGNRKEEAEIEKIKAETERIRLETEQLKAIQTATTDEKSVLDKLVDTIIKASK